MYKNYSFLETDSFANLKIRAEKVLEKSPPEQKTVSYLDAHTTAKDLALYKTALQIQNEDLQNALLEIETTRNRYCDLYDFIPFGYFTLSHTGNIIEVNEAGASLLGIKKIKLITKTFSRYITPDSQSTFMNHIEIVLEKIELQTCEIKLMRKDGPVFYAEINSKCLVNSLTHEKCILLFLLDITEKKQKERAIQNPQKIISLEQNNSADKFAAVVVHELNHPLSISANYLYGCIHRLESGQFQLNEIISTLKMATTQTHRAANIILRLKNFTCKGNLKYEPIKLEDLIQESIQLISHEIADYPLKIFYHPRKTLPTLIIDKIHIQQVILNLARNAIEAMQDANTADPKLTIEVDQLKTDKVEISIIDNGPGFSDKNIYKLFNPYYSTKPYGIGLGLSVCQSIVEAHGGQMNVECTAFGSACFKFTLPIKIQKQKTTCP